MRTVPSAWATLETARQRNVALLVHIYAKRDGRVTLPDGWGSWTYSVGFQGNVDFTDLADYAGEGSLKTRSYVPAAIEFDASQVFRQESTVLDPHGITMKIDPGLDPFLNYVNRKWPLTFGIVIYRVHRNGGSIATADDGHGNQIPVVDVAFIGYLDADDTLETNASGMERTIQGGKLKLETKWDHITKILDRLVPRPVFSVDCPKSLFSATGHAAIDCNADMPHVQVDGIVIAQNGVLVSALEWGLAADSWFAQGMLVYTTTDPISGLDFTFKLGIGASRQRASGGLTYGDLTLDQFPPLPIVGMAATAFGGCDRSRATCMTKHVPAGSAPPPPGAFTPGSLEVAFDLVDTGTGSPNHATVAYVYISHTDVKIVYFHPNPNQIIGIFIATVPWDPTWVGLTSSSLVTNPTYALGAGAGMPNTPGYKVTISNSGATATILQQPTANNGYVCIVRCGGGAGNFDFTIAWTANAGQPLALGNLSNFGGTDIPVEHPSLETTQ